MSASENPGAMWIRTRARPTRYHAPRRFVKVRAPALAGIIGPVLFWTVLIALGQMQSAYSAFRSDISLLALGANGWAQTVNFVVFGLLIIVFQGGLRRAVATEKAWEAINYLALAFGLGLVSVAIFPTDRAGTWTVHGAVHLGIVAALALLLPFLCFMTATKVKRHAFWRGYAQFSVLIAILTGALTLVLLLAWSGAWQALHPWLGLYERVVFALPSIWMEIMAIHLLRMSRVEDRLVMSSARISL
jgi:hypothetical protein